MELVLRIINYKLINKKFKITNDISIIHFYFKFVYFNLHTNVGFGISCVICYEYYIDYLVCMLIYFFAFIYL